MRRMALAAAVAALPLLLVGCGGEEPTANLSIDGESVDLGGSPSVECRSEDGSRFVFITPEEPSSDAEGFTLQFTPADGSPEESLEVVAYADSDGNGLVYQKGLGRSPVVTSEGDAYTVSGTGRNVDEGELPDEKMRSFEVSVTCP